MRLFLHGGVRSRGLRPLWVVSRGCESGGASREEAALSRVWRFGSGELQGRRPYMEDRHLAIPCLAKHTSGVLPQNLGLFAVFDGHGGDVTSSYAQKNFAQILASLLADSALISLLYEW